MARNSGEPWLLVTDAERRPRGWIAAAGLDSRSPDGRIGEEPLAPYGHAFHPARDSLRSALDATVLSRTERAVAVDDEGRVTGVTSYERLRDAIRAAEAAAEDSAARDSAAKDSATEDGAADGPVPATATATAGTGAEPQS